MSRIYSTADYQPNQQKRSFSEQLLRLSPNGMMPLYGLSGMAKMNKISAVAHSYWSKRQLFPKVISDGPTNDSATTIPVLNSGDVKVGSILLNYQYSVGTWAPPELLRVINVPSATSIEVVRGFAGTTPASITAGKELIETGTAYEEGSSMPVARSVDVAEHTNFTQIFRDSWDITRTAMQVSLEPNMSQMAENKEDAAHFHGTGIEYSMIFGRKSASVVNGKPLRTMDGIEATLEQFAPGNLHAAGSTTTYKQLEAMLDPLLDTQLNGRGSWTKTLYCGSQAIKTINEIGRASGDYEIIDGQTAFGMQFKTFRTSRGQFEMIEHQLLNAQESTKGMAIVGDTNTYKVQHLQPTMHEETAFDGVDATSGVYTTELTMEMQSALQWGIIYNLTAGA